MVLKTSHFKKHDEETLQITQTLTPRMIMFTLYEIHKLRNSISTINMFLC